MGTSGGLMKSAGSVGWPSAREPRLLGIGLLEGLGARLVAAAASQPTTCWRRLTPPGARRSVALDSSRRQRRWPSPPPPAEAPVSVDRLERLKMLGELRASGVLTETEFEAQKAMILAGG